MGKFKSAMEWVEHGKTIVEIVIALGGGTVVRAALTEFTKIPPIWITPIWLFSAGGFFWLLVAFFRKRLVFPAPRTEQSTAMTKAAEDLNVQYTNNQFAAIDARFRDDIEKAVREQISRVPAGEARETYVVRITVVLVVTMILEEIWNIIWASKILALNKLNEGGLKREGIFPFYTSAATQWPGVYATYTFDQWLGFLRSQTLIRDDGDEINITVKGRQFLKYLLDSQRSAEQKTF